MGIATAQEFRSTLSGRVLDSKKKPWRVDRRSARAVLRADDRVASSSLGRRRHRDLNTLSDLNIHAAFWASTAVIEIAVAEDQFRIQPADDFQCRVVFFCDIDHALAFYYASHPESDLLTGKSLVIGGSHQINQLHEEIHYGDLSAVNLRRAAIPDPGRQKIL